MAKYAVFSLLRPRYIVELVTFVYINRRKTQPVAKSTNFPIMVNLFPYFLILSLPSAGKKTAQKRPFLHFGYFPEAGIDTPRKMCYILFVTGCDEDPAL